MPTAMRPVYAPERTCVGCRGRAPASALARFALLQEGPTGTVRAIGAIGSSGGKLVLWGEGRTRPAGRGASLHRDAACLRAALKSGAFARAFRGRVEIGDEAELLQQLASTFATSRQDKDRKSP
jgi:predicted RNA-binding protein YlxR (DUF448 family)